MVERRSHDKNRTGAIGEGEVGVLLRRMGYEWHPFDSKTFGIDGTFEIIRNNDHTGLWVAVQVKTGSSYMRRKTKDGFAITVSDDHLEAWQQSRLPVILVVYDMRDRVAYWKHLNLDRNGCGGSPIMVPANQKLGTHAKGAIFRLAADFYGSYLSLPIIKDKPLLKLTVGMAKSTARNFYNLWKSEGCLSEAYGEVLITSHAWKHITSHSRTQRDILSKLDLLSCAREILTHFDKRDVLRIIETPGRPRRVLYQQRAVIRWPLRSDFEVVVVTEKTDGQPYRFYSVFERRFRKKGEGNTPGFDGKYRSTLEGAASLSKKNP